MVVDLIDRQRSGGDGTPAMATVVFFDVVGSTETMARLEDESWRDALEEARDLLDPLIDFIIDTVRELGGTIARVQGDGVMAVFGAPKPLEKHAIAACAAALKVRDHFRDRMLMVGPGKFAAVRIGINFGRIIIRNRKHDVGGVLDIFGRATHDAKKVEALCPPNAVLITHETLLLAGAAVEARHWDGALFEVVAVALHHDLDRQFPADLLEPFVGRKDILDRLVANMGHANQHNAKTIAVVGTAGVGKSRILFELSRRVESQGVRVIEMRGHAAHKLTPFAPVKPLIAKLRLAGGSVEEAAARPLPPSLEQGILELTGSATDDEWNKLEASARRQVMIEAACMLVARAASAAPVLVVADDAQDFDAETHDFLTRLKSLAADAKVAIVVTARTHKAVPAAVDEIIGLELLNDDQAWQFAHSTAAGAEIDQADMARAIKNAGGNPLFLQSLIRHLRSGAKNGAPPAELASLVQARMNNLTDHARTVLWAASVLRANVAKRTLAATVDMDDALLEPLLAELEREDLIAIDATGVRFRHAMLHDAVDGLLARRVRNELHARARAVLETQPQTAELLDQLTYHAGETEDFVGALAYLSKSVQLAKRTSSLKTIRALYDRAQKLKNKAGANAVPAWATVTIESLDALQQSGDREEYRRALEFVAEHAARTGDLPNEGLARAHLALQCWMNAEHDVGLEHARTALAIAEKLNPERRFALRALAQPHLANIEHALGNIDRAIALHEEVVAALEGEYEKTTLGRMIVPSVRSRAFLAWFMIDRGRFDDAGAHIARGEETLLAIQQPYSRVLLNAARGYLALRTGRPQDAIAPLEQAREFCLQGFFVMEPCVTGWLAAALIETGDHQRARDIAMHSIEKELYRHGGRYTWVFVHVALSEALFLCGEMAKALATADAALDIAQISNEPINIAQALFARGRIKARSGNVAAGLEDLRAAHALAERHKLDPLARDCRRALDEFGPN
jgi:class 3 adenylate cyclase/tetratricopeptide (TPR) repeat protein